jgi:EmrB/QacA subfamily drug resistance transporter
MQRKWQVLTVVGVGVFMSSLDLFIVNVAFPDIRAEFGATSIGGLSWVLNAYAIVFAALMVPAGRWADALGRKRVFTAGLLIFVLGSALCAAAPSAGLLVAARVVQAAGGALLIPSSLGLLLPEFPPEERPVAIAIWAAVGGVAAAAGPPLGGLLVELDWRWVFLVNVPVGLVIAVFGVRLLNEQRDPSTLRPDVLGAVGVTLGMGALVGAIVQGPDWGWTDPRVLGGFLLAAVLTVAVARRSLVHPAPIVDPAMVRIRSFSVSVVACTVYYAGFGAMLFGSVLFLTGVWGEDALHAGLMIAPGPTAAALTAVPGSKIAARIGFARAGLLGGIVTASGALWWLATLGPERDFAGAFLPGMVIGGIGVGLTLPIFTAAATAELPPTRFSTGAAVVTMGRQLGTALGVAAVVVIVGSGTAVSDFHDAWIFFLIAAVAAGGVLAGVGALGRAPATATAPETVPAS